MLIEEASDGYSSDRRGECNIVTERGSRPYNAESHSEPNLLEVDHVVALKEAHDSGAWEWDDGRLVAFANDLTDPRTLRAVTGATNTDKGDADPSNWIPPNAVFVCQYLADWVSIKARWGLSMDESEYGRIRNLLTDRCPDQRITPWAEVPAVPPAAAPHRHRRSTPPPPPPPAPDPPPIQPAVPLPARPRERLRSVISDGVHPAKPTGP